MVVYIDDDSLVLKSLNRVRRSNPNMLFNVQMSAKGAMALCQLVQGNEHQQLAET